MLAVGKHRVQRAGPRQYKEVGNSTEIIPEWNNLKSEFRICWLDAISNSNFGYADWMQS